MCHRVSPQFPSQERNVTKKRKRQTNGQEVQSLPYKDRKSVEGTFVETSRVSGVIHAKRRVIREE